MATARWLRERYLAPHRWIAARLNMGGAGSVQTLVSRHRREPKNQNSSWEMLNSYEILDWCFSGRRVGEPLREQVSRFMEILKAPIEIEQAELKTKAQDSLGGITIQQEWDF